MRTPENLELTNPQEFGGSWAAVEVKPFQAGSLPSPRWARVNPERAWLQVRGGGHWCEADLAIALLPLTPCPEPRLCAVA